VTKILFIEEDLTAFEIRKCIAAVLEGIQPLELFHAKDATEGLELLDEVKPDVIVIGHEESSETELLLDGLTMNHPPVVVDHAENQDDKKRSGVTYLKSDGSLEGIHQLLKTAQSLAALGSVNTDLAN
jgi:chemotaxis response regulator CheB